VVLAVLDSAAHVCATAQRRLDLPVTIGALGDLHHLAIWQAEIVVLKRCVAMTAGCVDGHVAFVTGVGSHRLSPVFDQWSDKRCVTIASVNIHILVIRKYEIIMIMRLKQFLSVISTSSDGANSFNTAIRYGPA
tara:strand:- start:10 stop:411 length:402 start_codon:yes stop_codon:yes gene_type:complete